MLCMCECAELGEEGGRKNEDCDSRFDSDADEDVSYTHLDVYKRQVLILINK